MIERSVTTLIEHSLTEQAAVAIIGPRQVGKTTLAREIAGSRPASLYLDLEAREDRDRLASQLSSSGSTRIVWSSSMKFIASPSFSVHSGASSTRGGEPAMAKVDFSFSAPLRLICCGRSSESLAGRITSIWAPSTCWSCPPMSRRSLSYGREAGFPAIISHRTTRKACAGAETLYARIWSETFPQFGPRVPAGVLERLWTMLAHGQGTLLNASRLASALQITAPTVQRYIDLLADLLLVRRLQPFHSNAGKRLVKSPKVYIRDSGLVHALLGLRTLIWLDILWQVPLGRASSLRTCWPPRRSAASPVSIARLLEPRSIFCWKSRPRTVGHRGQTEPIGSSQKGFYIACRDLKPDKQFVVNAGLEQYPIDAETVAISIPALARMLSALTI